MTMKPFSDLELLERLQRDDELALNLIFKKYWQPLFIAAYNLLKDKDTCEDIVQDIFIRIWDRRYELEIKTTLRSYLYAAVRYEVFRQIKLGNVREEFFERVGQTAFSPSPHEDLAYQELVGKIDSVISELPERCQKVYRLSREEQLSHKEISEKLKISTKTVETHITKALKHLRLIFREIGTF